MMYLLNPEGTQCAPNSPDLWLSTKVIPNSTADRSLHSGYRMVLLFAMYIYKRSSRTFYPNQRTLTSDFTLKTTSNFQDLLKPAPNDKTKTTHRISKKKGVNKKKCRLLPLGLQGKRGGRQALYYRSRGAGRDPSVNGEALLRDCCGGQQGSSSLWNFCTVMAPM